ncbi:hypothetical protein MRX96_025244 [Rhipicephalus microplus]
MRRLETNDQKEMQGEREKEINEYLHWAKNAASPSGSAWINRAAAAPVWRPRALHAGGPMTPTLYAVDGTDDAAPLHSSNTPVVRTPPSGPRQQRTTRLFLVFSPV